MIKSLAVSLGEDGVSIVVRRECGSSLSVHLAVSGWRWPVFPAACDFSEHESTGCTRDWNCGCVDGQGPSEKDEVVIDLIGF